MFSKIKETIEAFKDDAEEVATPGITEIKEKLDKISKENIVIMEMITGLMQAFQTMIQQQSEYTNELSKILREATKRQEEKNKHGHE